MLISKKISAKFQPNFAKFGNFGGGRNFGDTEIKNLASHQPCGFVLHDAAISLQQSCKDHC